MDLPICAMSVCPLLFVVCECGTWCAVACVYVCESEDDLFVGVGFFHAEDLWDAVGGGVWVFGGGSPVGFACP